MTQAETKACQNCKNPFTIEPDDFAFYEKLKVPPPTWCPDCRNMRRMAWREYRALYRGVCALCGKNIITIHAPASAAAMAGKPGGPFTVYCRECYKSDKWDPMDYGRDYNFNKPFFKQYRELMEAVPQPALTGNNLVNSDFTHGCESVKNYYYVFFSYFSQDSENCFGLLLSRDSFDCYVSDNSDHAYECLHSNRLYKTSFGYFSDDCLDSAFLYECVGCSDCFGCVNLRKKKFCLFNEQLPKEEYRAQRKEWDLGSYKKLNEAKEKFRALYLVTPRRFAHMINSQNSTGDVIRDAKNCQMCFTALDAIQDCKYIYGGGLNLKDSMDISAGGDTVELCYETYAVTGNAARCCFSAGGGNCRDTWYSDWANNSSDVFGCVSLRNKRFCVLNKQYSREEYEALVPRIKRHMDEVPYVDKRGRVYKFGEFFPAELSAYAYNECFGFQFYPKTKEEVLAEGWRWQESPARSYHVTMEPEHLPDHIRDVPDSIVNEVIGCLYKEQHCAHCVTAFRISSNELAFHRTMSLALPRLCPGCREEERLTWRNRFQLWTRRCQCEGQSAKGKEQGVYPNTAAHFHGAAPCPNEFETTYAPEKSEIIYCDQCYKAEFL